MDPNIVLNGHNMYSIWFIPSCSMEWWHFHCLLVLKSSIPAITLTNDFKNTTEAQYGHKSRAPFHNRFSFAIQFCDWNCMIKTNHLFCLILWLVRKMRTTKKTITSTMINHKPHTWTIGISTNTWYALHDLYKDQNEVAGNKN